VALRLEGGPSLRLDSGTLARLVSGSVIELTRGALYVDSDATSASDLLVRTVLGDVRDIGTRFQVRLEDGPLTVMVRDGSVAVTSQGRRHELARGAAVRIDADGTVERSPLAATDPAWDWVQRVAPPFAIEGRTVAQLLEWVSEETGLSIEYQDADLEAFARRTVLHGSVAELTPAQVPEVVLPSCGLEARLLESRLVIVRQRE
jgi:hypothetical protein